MIAVDGSLEYPGGPARTPSPLARLARRGAAVLGITAGGWLLAVALATPAAADSSTGPAPAADTAATSSTDQQPRSGLSGGGADTVATTVTGALWAATPTPTTGPLTRKPPTAVAPVVDSVVDTVDGTVGLVGDTVAAVPETGTDLVAPVPSPTTAPIVQPGGPAPATAPRQSTIRPTAPAVGVVDFTATPLGRTRAMTGTAPPVAGQHPIVSAGAGGGTPRQPAPNAPAVPDRAVVHAAADAAASSRHQHAIAVTDTTATEAATARTLTALAAGSTGRHAALPATSPD